MSLRILVVEDDASLREALVDTLELSHIEALQAASGEEALEVLKSQHADMVITDVNMPGIDGHQLLAVLRKTYPALPVALITAFGQVDRAVDAIRAGAVDYLCKPFEPHQLIDLIQQYAGGASVSLDPQDNPIAESASSRQVLQLAQRVAVTDSTVLITGESGTGKEVLARYIHVQSERADKPFVAINCAAIPENMLEATLFGHEKGAFTGAVASAPGKFEQANGGTLLLDEITEMPLSLQAKLLRVLQEREVERIGGRKTIELDVRVLATSNRDLESYVSQGDFREDLYYRLNVFPLHWQPLRERPDDIVPLAQRILDKQCKKMHRSAVQLTASAQAQLRAHPWPGNVRELDNLLQRALILQTSNSIGEADLMFDAKSMNAATLAPTGATLTSGSPMPAEQASGHQELGQDLKNHEYQLILDALKACRGSRKDAADKLGISPRTLRYKLARMREDGLDLSAI